MRMSDWSSDVCSSDLNLITLPLDFFSNRRVGELNSRLSADLSQIQDTMTTTFAEIIRQIITLVGGVCWLLIVSGKLTLLNLSILPKIGRAPCRERVLQ